MSYNNGRLRLRGYLCNVDPYEHFRGKDTDRV